MPPANHSLRLALAAIASVAACRPASPADALPRLERELAQALMRRDSLALEGLLASDFPVDSLGASRAGTTRPAWIAYHLRRIALDTVGVGTVTVERREDGLAAARLWLYQRGTMGTMALDESLYVADVWEPHGRSWRLKNREVLDCRPPRAEC